MEKRKKKNFGIFAIFMLVCVILIVKQFPTQTNEPESNSVKLQDYIIPEENGEKVLETWTNLDGDDKNYAYSKAPPQGKENFISNLATKLAEKKLKEESTSGTFKTMIDNLAPGLFTKLNEAKINIFEDLEDAKRIAKQFKIDLDIEFYQKNKDLFNTALESVDGFDNPLLRWAKKGNVIGDGNVWLDLENLPLGTAKITYRDGNFILERKDGNKIILGPGSTSETGEVTALLKWKDKYKGFSPIGLSEKGIVDLMLPTRGDFSIRNFIFESGKGNIVLNKNGFEIIGDGIKVRYGDFVFARRNEETTESIVQLGFDRVVLKGTEFMREGYAKVASSSENFIVHFGNPDGLAREINVPDVTGLKGGTIYNPPTGTRESIGMRFDENGQLISIRKDSFRNGQWIPITLGLYTDGRLSDSLLADIYSTSSESMKKIISDANTRGLTYWDVFEKFYADPILGSRAKEITTLSSAKNFLNINGENFNVGGTGTIEILRNLNSLTGIQANEFRIKNREMDFIINGNEVYSNSRPVKNSFSIEDISTIYNGRNEPVSYQIKSDGDYKILSQSERISTGRQTVLLPYGISSDVSIDIDPKNMDVYRVSVSGLKPGENIVSAMMDSDFRLNFDVYIPEGIKIDAQSVREIVQKNLVDKMSDMLKEQTTPEIIDSLGKLITSSLSGVENIRSGKISLSMQNTPGIILFSDRSFQRNSPVVMLNLPGEKSKTILLDSASADIFNNILEGSLRAPDFQKGVTTSSVLPYPTFRWPPEYLGRLWYDNLGMNTRTSSVEDLAYVIRTYAKNRGISYSEAKKELKEIFSKK